MEPMITIGIISVCLLGCGLLISAAGFSFSLSRTIKLDKQGSVGKNTYEWHCQQVHDDYKKVFFWLSHNKISNETIPIDAPITIDGETEIKRFVLPAFGVVSTAVFQGKKLNFATYGSNGSISSVKVGSNNKKHLLKFIEFIEKTSIPQYVMIGECITENLALLKQDSLNETLNDKKFVYIISKPSDKEFDKFVDNFIKACNEPSFRKMINFEGFEKLTKYVIDNDIGNQKGNNAMNKPHEIRFHKLAVKFQNPKSKLYKFK